MKRADALLAMVFAGYHGDSATWTQLYIENRVSYEVAKEKWRAGVRAKASGIPCTCGECKPKAGAA